MGRKDSVTKKKSGPSQTASTSNPSTKAPQVAVFPPLSAKENLVCETLEPDQIILIHDAFSVEECKHFIKFIGELPLELTPPPKKGEAERVNHRISIASQPFAEALFSVLSPHLPLFPYPPSQIPKRGAPSTDLSARPAHSFNSNIRLYKYTEGQHFGCHYDDWVRDTITGARSEWTLLIYLSGEEDGIVGGETIFYKGQGKRKETIIPPLRRGMALLHRHGHECLLHEGALVQKGTKYVLRSDVMFI